MGFLRHRSRPEDDDGFSLVETIVAMVVLGSILLVTITVISSSFRTLGGAKETDVANNIGQARIEAARSLAFGDVGTVAGSPAGTITPSETVEIQGVDLQVDTTVQWVGSATGLDLVTGTQSGDGVPGFFDPGIDYKLVTVTVTPNGNDPIVFETIIAPPNVAAAEDAANLIITIAKDEPADAPSDTSLPRVYLHPASGLIAGGLGLEEVPFLDIEDAVDHPIRLGPTINDTSDGTWAMADPTLSTSVGAATTSSEVLTIYRPITLEITATDDVGTLLSDASVVVTDQATSDNHNLGMGWQPIPGSPGRSQAPDRKYTLSPAGRTDRRDNRTTARGNDQLPVLNLRSIAERQCSVVALQPLDPYSGYHPELGIILVLPEKKFVFRYGLVHELGQQGAIVTDFALGIDKSYRFPPVLLTKTKCRLHAGYTAADDYAIHNFTPRMGTIFLTAKQR